MADRPVVVRALLKQEFRSVSRERGMGRQFSFFLGPNDQEPFEDGLRAAGDTTFLKYWPLSPFPEELQSSRVSEPGKEVLTILVACRADLPLIRFTHIKGRAEFSCQSSSAAPIVEFARCYVTDRFIRAGRLYRTDVYWNEANERQKKSPEFIAWADRLYKFGKRSLTPVDRFYYAGADALRLRSEGVAFEGLDIRIGSVAG